MSILPSLSFPILVKRPTPHDKSKIATGLVILYGWPNHIIHIKVGTRLHDYPELIMACKALGCKQEAKFENGIGVHVCSVKCANKIKPDAHLIMAEKHHMLDHPSDPSLIRIHKTSPMIGIYRKEPCLVLRKGKANLDQCVSAERPDYFEVNKKVAQALKTALVGISKEEIERQLEEARLEAEEVARKRQELKKQLEEAKEEERKRKAEQSEAKKMSKSQEKERRAEERRRQKEETRKRRNEKARIRRQEKKEKEAAKKASAEGGGGGGGGKEVARKKPTGKQLDELNDDVLLLMIAQLDEESLRAMSMVNQRFNDLAFPILFQKSTDISKMRFMYMSIVNGKWRRLAYAFSKYSSFDFSMSEYFRKLFIWSSPWSKADKFLFVGEDMEDIDAWEENETKISAEQVENALDIYIRVVFFKEDNFGEIQPIQTPNDMRMFVPDTLKNLANFHHLNMLNRFFTDRLWKQTILIDEKIARQETMIYAANSGFVAYVVPFFEDADMLFDYKNFSVLGVLTGETYRSPYADSEIFLSLDAASGPIDISDELNQVARVINIKSSVFTSAYAIVQNPFLFYRYNLWWDNQNSRPDVIAEDILEGPVTSKENNSLARAVFNVRKEIIDMILPYHKAIQLEEDIDLARMLVYYYPIATKRGTNLNASNPLELFDRVMQKSNNKLVPVGFGPKMIYSAYTYLFEGTGDNDTDLMDNTDLIPFFSTLRIILLRDPRLSPEKRMSISDAIERAISEDIPDFFIDEFDTKELTEEQFPDPWTMYWQQASQSSPMQM